MKNLAHTITTTGQHLIEATYNHHWDAAAHYLEQLDTNHLATSTPTPEQLAELAHTIENLTPASTTWFALTGIEATILGSPQAHQALFMTQHLITQQQKEHPCPTEPVSMTKTETKHSATSPHKNHEQ